jgi:hypothetical protein
VGYWTFDDQTADDLTLNANHGTFAGNSVIAPSGQVFGANGVGPVADAGISAAVETSQTVAVQIGGTDGDGDAVAFALVSTLSDSLGAPLTLTDADPTDNFATVTYEASGGAGADTFSFTVTDGVETSAAQSVAVTVNLPTIAWSTSTGAVTLFDGVADYEDTPDDLIHSRTSVTVETWFRTTATNGVLFGYQGGNYPSTPTSGTVPALYTGSDGLLRGALWPANAGAPLNSGTPVNDGTWHHAALVGDVVSHHLYVDGVLAGTYAVAVDHLAMTGSQVGVGWDAAWLGLGAIGWDFWRGDVANFNVWDGALAANDVAAIAAVAPTQEVPNLTASFAGNADYILIPANASLDVSTDLTVEAWIYPTGLGSGGGIGGTVLSQEGAYTFARWGDGNMYFAVANTSHGYGWVYSGVNAPLDTWSHWAFTYSATTGLTTSYIDGVPGAPIAVTGAIGDITPGQNDVWIGEREISPHAFDGEIDELRVWNVARSEEEIGNAYTKSLTPAEAQSVPGLVGYWTFDDGTANDLTANGNSGSFVNQAGIVGSPESFGGNTAPAAGSGVVVSLFTDETGGIGLTGVDADGDLLSFSTTAAASDSLGASLTVADADTTDNAATVEYAATATPGSDTFSFTVSDGIAISAAEAVNVTASAPTNRALSVDGSLDYVNAAESASTVVTTAFTLEAWVYPTGPGSEPNYGGVIVGRAGEYLLSRFPDGTIRFAHGMTTPGYGWVDTGVVAPLGTWTHIAQTYDAAAGFVETYANGVAGVPVAASGVVGDAEPVSNEVWIGDRQALEQAFEGQIDEVRVWDIARTPIEIANAYSKTLSAGEAAALPNLKGYWNFDDGTPNDLSAYGNHGALAGDAALLGSAEVYDANAMPFVNPIAPTTVLDGNTVDVTLSAVDSDGDYVTFALTSEASDALGAPLALVDSDLTDNVATVTYSAAAGTGVDTFTFTVSDGITTTAVETVSVTVDLPANSAASFDGAFDASSTPDSVNFGQAAAANFDTNDDFTVEVWVKPDTVQNSSGSGDNSIIEKVSGTPYPFLIRLRNQDHPSLSWTLSASRRDSGNTRPLIDSTTTLGDGAWHHIAFTKTGSALALYVDGVLEGTTTDTTSATTTNADPLVLGIDSVATRPFAGLMDEFRVWNVGRTQDEIVNAMGKTLSGFESGLTGYWNFDDATAADLTVNGAAGSFIGDASTTASALALSPNTPPSADAGITASVEAGQTVVIPITGTDADADGLQFSLDSNFTSTFVVGLSLTDADPTDAAATVTYTAPILSGADTFTFTVTDGLDTSASATVTINITQPANSSVTFDGTGDSVSFGHVAAADFDTDDDFTLELWVKPNTTQSAGGSDNSIIENIVGNPYPFLIRLGNQTHGSAAWSLRASRRDSNSVQALIISTATLGDGLWHHVAFAKTGETLSLYVDGALDSTTADVTTTTTANAASLLLLGLDSAGGRAFAGEMDEFRIWNVGRTHEEIVNGMTKSLLGWETGLVGYWNFDTGTAADGAGANDGTFVGNAATGPSAQALVYNTAPVASAGITGTAEVGQTVSITVSATDADGDALSFELPLGEGGEPYSDLGATITLTDADPTDNVATLLYTADGGTGADTVQFAASDGMHTSNYETVTIDVSLPANAAANFDGTLDSTGDYVLVADDPLLDMTVMTMEAWVNWDGVTSFATVMSRPRADSGAPGTGMVLNIVSGVPTLGFNNGANYNVSGSTSVTAGVWTHLAGTYDGQVLKVYADGVLGGTNDIGSAQNLLASSAGLLMGREFVTGLYNRGFSGQIDEARLWDHVRTEQEIQGAMNVALTGSEPGIVGYWTFDDGTASDVSPNALGGSFNSGAGVVGSSLVFPANTPPVAVPTAATVDSGQTVAIAITGSDADGAPVTFALVSEVSAFGAPLALTDADPTDSLATVSYTATGGAGADTFDFMAYDGVDTSVAQTATVSVGAPANQALALDGVDGRAVVGDAIALDTNISSGSGLTVETWFRTSDPALTDTALVFKWASADPSYVLHFAGIPNGADAGGLRFELFDGTSLLSAESGSWYNDGFWHHAAGVWQDDTARLYIDGFEVASATVVGFGELSDSTADLAVGAASVGGESGYFPGDVDEVRVWDVARTAEEIQSTLGKSLSGTEAGLAGYWSFDDGFATDLTVNGNDGSFVGGASVVSSAEVFAANTAPTADAGSIPVEQGSVGTALISGTDADGDLLSFGLVSEVSSLGATLTLSDADPTDNVAEVTYTADAAAGADSFDFIVTDGIAAGVTGTFDVTVTLPANSAATFDGSAGSIDVPDAAAYDFDVAADFTLSLWVKPDAVQVDLLGTTNSIIEKWDAELDPGSGFPYTIRYNNQTHASPGYFGVARYDGAAASGFESTVPVDDGAWHHIAFVKQGALLSLYVDGLLDGTASDTLHTSTPGSTQNAAAVTLGRRGGNTYPSYLSGALDEVRIWDYGRTQEEIQNEMGKALGGAEVGLVGYWNFDDGAATDLTLSGADGVFVGSPTTMPSVQAFGTNTPPAATAVSGTAIAGLTSPITLTGADTDGDLLSFALLSATSALGGALTLTDADPTDNAATVSYSAPSGGGTDTFDFAVSDGMDESAAQTATITVSATGDIALSLDGVGDYMPTALTESFAAYTALTYEAWIYPTGPGSSGTEGAGIIAKQGELNLHRFPDGTIQHITGGRWSWQGTTTATPLNTWSHVAITYSGADGLFSTYINGVLEHTYAAGAVLADYVTGNEVLHVGSLNASHNFEGILDEVRVWDVRRTAAEIAGAYQTTLAGSETGLIGYWPFDDGTPNDVTISGGDGTLTGDATLVVSTAPLVTNTAPVATPGITATANTGDVVAITVTGTDADATPVVFALPSATSAFGAPLTLTDADGTDNIATVTYTAIVGVGDDTFEFTVSDGVVTTAPETVTVTVTAVGNQAATFDGSGDYVNVGADASLAMTTAMTVEAWIYPRGPGERGVEGGIIVSKEGEYELGRYPDGTIRYSVATTSPGWVWVNTTDVAPQDAWTHVAWTYDSTVPFTAVYVNGVLAYSSVNVTGAIGDVTIGQDELWIGNRSDIPHGFDGDIDEVRVWNYARTAEEIGNGYSKTISSVEASSLSGLVGSWNFDDVTANDLSTSVNDGVLTGNAAIIGSSQTLLDNTAPVATAGIAVSLLDGGTGQVTLTGTDAVDGDLLTFQLLSSLSDVLAATVSLEDELPDDNISTAGYASLGSGAATDTFSFTVSDGISTSAPALVTVNVTEPIAVSGIDLLVNGGGEDLSLTGWQIVSSTWPMDNVASPGTAKEILPYAGSYFFFSGSDAVGELRQDIDLGGYATQIAAGTASFSFDGYVRSWNQTAPDSSRVIVEYYTGDPSAGGSITESYDTGEVINTSSWQQVTDTRTPASGTTWARIRLIATRYGGTNNDGDFDALRFLVSGPPEVVWSQTLPAQSFDGIDDADIATDNIILDQGGVFAIDTWFRTLDSGVIFGYQDAVYPSTPTGFTPALYVGTDGLLRGAIWQASLVTPLTSSSAVNDGQWHHAAVVAGNARHHLYLDGSLVGTYEDRVVHGDFFSAQIGVGSTGNWPAAAAGWFPYRGDVASLTVWGGILSAAEIANLAVSPPIDTPDNSTAAFDGSGDAIIVADSASLTITDELTLEAWVYPTGAGQDGVDGGAIIAKEGEYQLSRNPDGEVWYVLANTSPGWTKVLTGYVAPLNTWTHLSFTYESTFGNSALYADGVSVFTTQGSGPIGDVDGTDNALWIGGRPGDPESFQGQIDEARVWNISRGGNAVASSYLKQHGGGEAGLVGYWSFDSDETANDRTANGNDGTLAGNTLILGSALALAVNNPPSMDAVAAQSVTGGESVDIAFTGTDADGDALTFVTVVEPSGGTLSVDNTTGTATYAPLLTFSGTDTFDIAASDGMDTSSSVTVSVAVTAADLDPEIAGLHELLNEDFESGVTGVWSNPTTSVTPNGTRGYLGQFANNTVTLTVPNIPAHAEVTIEFDLYINKSWDGLGSAGNDVWAILADGAPLLQTTFSNVPLDFWSFFSGNWRQSYPAGFGAGNYPLKWGAVESNSLGFSYFGDSVYRFNFTVPHTADTLTYTFAGSGLEGVSNESWGLDNVRVTTQHVNIEEDIVSEITLPGSDPGGDAVTFTITTPPTNGTITGTGPLFSYTPTLDYNGLDQFGYTVSDGTTTTAESTVVIEIDPVDDAPILDAIAAVTVFEDSGEATVTITGIGAGGDTDEDVQTIALVATSLNSAYIPTPTITGTTATRTLTFTPAADATGDVTILVTATDTGLDGDSGGPSGATHFNTGGQQFTVTLTPLNDAPSFDAVTDVTMDEDATPSPISITTVSAGGGADELTQTVTVTATSSDTAIVPDPTVSGTGDTRVLTFTPVAETSGTVTVTVTATDDGADDGATEFSTTTDTFTITINAVNDAPLFDEVATLTFDEDSGPVDVTITGVATGGGGDEAAAQNVTLVATSSLPGLVPNPTITGSGTTRTVTIDSIADASGGGTITITATDDGGVTGGSDVDTYSQTFTFLVSALNDAPLFDDVAAVAVDEDAGLSTVGITGVSPGGGDDEASQSVIFTATSSDPTIVPDPAVSSTGTTGTVVYTPAAEANGTVTITLTASDTGSGTAPNVNALTKTFDITVNAVNDAPSFDAVADLAIDEDSAAGTLDITSIAVGGGDDEAVSQSMTLVATSSDPTILPDPTLTGTGTSRTLAYAPVADATGVVTITVVGDDGGPTAGASDIATATQTFDITVTAIDDGPTLAAIADITIAEDAGLTTIYLGEVGPGGGVDEAGQTLSFTSASLNPTVIPSFSIAAGEVGYEMTFTPADDANGVVTVVASVTDTGSSVSPSVNQVQQTFDVTITAIDDAPSFDFIDDVTASEDSAPVSVLISTVSAGPSDESTQTVTLTVSSSDPTLIPDPALSGSGDTWTLTFQPEPAVNGTVTITVSAVDDGNSVSPNANAYSQDFLVTVVPVNDSSTADDTTGATDEDVAVSIPITGADLDGDILSFLLWDGQGGVLTDITSLNGGVVSLTDADTSDNAATALYTPPADFNGTDTFLFIVNDGTLDSATATVTITVAAIADAPVATDAITTTTEETAVAIVITGVDADGDPVTVLLWDGAAGVTTDITSTNGGTVSIAATVADEAAATYTPPADFNGDDTFEFVVNDGVSDSAVATVTITVDAVNDAPTVTTDTATTTEDTATTVVLTGNDSDGDLLTVLLWDGAGGTSADITSVNGATVSIGVTAQNTATATYTPAQDFAGDDTFEYMVNDGTTDSAPATVTVTVSAVNDEPTVSAIAVTTSEDAQLDISLTGVDVEADALTMLLWDVEFSTVGPVTTANGGTVSVGSTTADVATATYVPAADFVGTDTFEFLANDGSLDSVTATVTVTVEGANDAPTATAAAATTSEDIALTVDLTGSDIDVDSLTVLLWDGAQGVTTDIASANGGVVSISATSADIATATYTPAAEFSGVDTFEFIVNDGVADSSVATATITVDAVDDAPIADGPGGPFTVSESATVDISLTGTDIDTAAVMFSLYDGVSTPPVLVLTTANAGSVVLTDADPVDNIATATYSPPADFDGVDTFEFIVDDGTSQSAAVTVSVTVTSTNDAPVATVAAATTSEDIAVAIALTGTDADGNVLTVLLWDGAQGVATDIASANGGGVSITDADTADSIATATYTPPADYNGADTFDFIVNDGTVDSSVATITITVDAVGDAPVATPTTATVSEDASVDIPLGGTDADGDVITVLLWDGAQGSTVDVTTAAGGTVSIGATAADQATATYTAPANYSGEDSFDYIVNDGALDSAVETVSITVDAVNDAPIVLGDAYATSEDTSVTFTLTGFDDDLDALTVLLWDGAQGVTGTIFTAEGGAVGIGTSSGDQASVTYTPPAEFAGQDEFEYLVNDGTVDSSTAVVTVTVAATNDAPVSADVTAQTSEDVTVDIALTGVDADFDALSLYLVDDSSAQVSTLTTANGATVTLSATDLPITGTDGVTVDQYATSVLDFSSEYSSGSWGATQALGEPDTGAYGDFATAWSPATANGGIEYLTVAFATEVYAEGAVITETYGNGFVFQVDVIDVVGTPHTVWSGSDTSGVGAPVDFAVSWPRTTFLVSGARIWVDTDTDLSTAEEVDAIRLLGSADTPGVDYVTATYTPAADYSGSDSFQYIVDDNNAASAVATVTVTVSPANDAPIASVVQSTTDEDVALDIVLTGSDPEADALTVLLWDGAASTTGSITTASGGTVTIAATTDDLATATYTPLADYFGEDSFEYVVNDGAVDSAATTVNLTVTSVNDAPLTDAVSADTSEDTPVDLVLSATDADGDAITVLLWDGAQGVTTDITTANGGTVAVGATTADQATATYTPAVDYSGTDTFEYIANDGSADSDATTVTVIVNAVDDAPTATDIDPLVVTEGDTLEITLSGVDADSTALTFYLSDGINTTEATVNGGLVTITDADPADTSATATYIPASGYDGVDTFGFVVSDGVTTSDPVTVSITVTSLPLLSIADVEVGEADGVATLTVSLSATSAQAVTVDVTTADDTATGSADYATTTATTLTIAAGSTSASMEFAITDDAVNEDDETFTVTLSSAANAALVTDTATVTITDDDDITLSIADVTVSEADGVAEFTVSASGDTEQVVTFDFATADADASSPGDYSAVTLTATTLDTTTGTYTVTVTLTDDAINEATETFTASISAATGRGVTIATDTATATILDDDGLSLSVVDATVSEAGGEAAIAIALSQASDQAITVDYVTTDVTASGGADYTTSTATMTFVPGATEQTIFVDILEDTVNEDDETFTLTLSNAAGEGVTLALDTATVTIADDDDVTVDLADLSITETDDGDDQAVAIPLTLSGESGQTITVDVETYAITATDGSDFDVIAGTYTFYPDGTTAFEDAATSGATDISVYGDTVNEDDETFGVIASSVTGRGVTVGVDTAMVTIADNDDVTLSIDDITIAEDDATGVATFTLTLSGESEQAVTVDVDVAGSGTALATLDADFSVTTPQTVTFDAGSLTQTLDVTILDDAVHEGDETYELVLTSPTGRGVTVADDTGLGTIIDGESLTVAIADASVIEGDSSDVTLSFEVTLSGVSEQTISLDIAVDAASTDGATEGADYTAPTDTTLTFAPGDTSLTFDLAVLADTINEADESVDVTIANPDATSITITDDVATGIISDNDDVTLTVASVEAAEGDTDTTTLTLDVTLSGESEQTITVDYVVTDVTATAGTDYVAVPATTLTLAAGETAATIDLTVNGDAANEADETVDIALSNVVGRGVTLTTDAVTATILNDDPLPALAIADVTVTEGTDTAATLTVTLTGETEQTVTVNYATANSTATAGDDYETASGSLTFEPDTTSATVDVTLVDDVLAEDDETFLVTLSAVSNATVSDGQASVTILNDDADASLSIVSPTDSEEFVAGTTSVDVVVSIANHVGGWRWKLGSDFLASDTSDGELVKTDTATNGSVRRRGVQGLRSPCRRRRVACYRRCHGVRRVRRGP